MTEPELTAETAAQLFGKVKEQPAEEPEHEPGPAPTPPASQGPTDDDRAEAARLFDLDPGLAHRLRGDTVRELVADAARLAKALTETRRQQEPKPRHVSFDGGVREPIHVPSDPEREHGEWLVEVIRQHREGGGGGW
jgi:hypothetical protein